MHGGLEGHTSCRSQARATPATPLVLCLARDRVRRSRGALTAVTFLKGCVSKLTVERSAILKWPPYGHSETHRKGRDVCGERPLGCEKTASGEPGGAAGFTAQRRDALRSNSTNGRGEHQP